MSSNQVRNPLVACAGALVGLVCAQVAACDGAEELGSCEVQSSAGAAYGWCVEGFTQAECDNEANPDDTIILHEGTSCPALGYTKQCSGDSPDTYRKPSFC